MRTKITAAIILLACIGLAIAIVKLKPAPDRVAAALPPAPKAAFVYATPQNHQLLIHTQGTVQAKHSTELRAQVSGRVVNIAEVFANGHFVDAGAVLATLDDTELQYQLIQQQAKLAQAEEVLATEKAKARQAKLEWHDLGSSEANDYFLRKPQLKNAKAQLTAAIAAVQKARDDINYTRITAPYNARIKAKAVSIGSYVAQGTIVGELFSTDAAEVRLPLSNREISRLDLSALNRADRGDLPKVLLSADIGGKVQQWPARIVRAEATFSEQSRVLHIVAQLDQPYSAEYETPLHIGLFVHAEISGKNHNNVIVLPRDALQSDDSLFVLNEANQLELFKPQIIDRDSHNIIIEGTLDPQARILVTLPGNPAPSMQVAPYEFTGTHP